MAENYEDLLKEADVIRTNELPSSNTAALVGGHLNKQLKYAHEQFSALSHEIKSVNKELGNAPSIETLSSETDFEISDEEGNVVARFNDGHFKTKNFDSKNSIVTNKEDDENYDLAFADDKSNVVLGISGGHIKTKNFDSSRFLRGSFIVGSPRTYFSGSTENVEYNDLVSNLTASILHELYDELVIANPAIFKRLDDIGTNVQGQELRHYVLGFNNPWIRLGYDAEVNYWDDKSFSPKRIIVSAGVHGDEKSCIVGLYLSIKDIIESDEEWANYIKSNFIIDVVPLVNPYGLDNNVRTNGSVDLNRDYASNVLQPETIAMKSLIELCKSRNLCAVIDLHNTSGKYAFMVTRDEYANHKLYCRLSYTINSLVSKNWREILNHSTASGYSFYVNRSTSIGMLAWYCNNNGIISTSIEAPRDCDNGSLTNKSKSCKMTKDLLINAIQIFGSL